MVVNFAFIWYFCFCVCGQWVEEHASVRVEAETVTPTLQHCFEMFQKPEQLSEENQWYAVSPFCGRTSNFNWWSAAGIVPIVRN